MHKEVGLEAAFFASLILPIRCLMVSVPWHLEWVPPAVHYAPSFLCHVFNSSCVLSSGVAYQIVLNYTGFGPVFSVAVFIHCGYHSELYAA